MKRILIFASGNGSNFQAIVEYFKNRNVIFELLTDKEDCYAIERAQILGVKHHFVPFKNTAEFLKNANNYDLFVLAGYMRVLPQEVLDCGTFINIHPSLLPRYKGMNAIEQAFEAREYECGVSIHYVNALVDSGEIIEQRTIQILPEMTLCDLETEVHKVEHEMYPKVIEKVLFGEKMNKINVLVVGSGARENAVAWKIKSSPLLNNLYLANPNDGFKELGEEIIYSDYNQLAKISKEKNIGLVVVGPELPLSEGIVDIFNNYGIKCIGANKKWAKLESSKSYAKEFMAKHNIPTAKYSLITDISQIDTVLSRFSTPPVLKADGLAAGKGVVLPQTFEEAKEVLQEFLGGRFGEASKNVVVEEFLEGEELSVISIFDGKTLKPLIPARDYKRLMDSNEGPNTGGMGAYCPVQIRSFHQSELDKYIKQLETALIAEQADFVGIIYSGLMLTKDDIKVLEYNMRFGDPETQPIMMHLKSDLLEIFINVSEHNLEHINIEWNEGSSLCVVLAAQGYPDSPKKGCEIKNILEVEEKYGVKIFYAGIKKENVKLLSDGGRVLSVCATGNNIRDNIYKACAEIDFSDKIFRNDIGVNNERINDYSRV